MTRSGRVMVPIRGVFEKLGATLQWVQELQIVVATKGVQHVALRVGSVFASVNHSPVIMEVPATVINQSVMVPLRFVSEALGARVDWNQNTRTAVISSGAIGDRCSPEWYDGSLTVVPMGKIVAKDKPQPVYQFSYPDLYPVPDMKLAPGAEMKVYEKTKFYGDDYYRTGKNLYVKASDSVNYADIPADQRTCLENAIILHHMERIVNGAAKQKSELAKLMYVYKELMDLVRYDYDTYRGLASNSLSYSWRGALAYGLAVCEGYSEALTLLLGKVGIESKMVSSRPMNHAWNMVKIDGEWYHVDATWEDTSRSIPDSPLYDLRYFLLSDEEITQQNHHSWVSDVKATSNKYARYRDKSLDYHFDFERGRLYFKSDGLWSDFFDRQNPVRLSPQEYHVKDIQYADDAIYFSTLNEGLFRVTYDGKVETLREGKIWDFRVYNNKLYYMVNESLTGRQVAVYVSDLDGGNAEMLNWFYDYYAMKKFYANPDVEGILFYYSEGEQYYVKS